MTCRLCGKFSHQQIFKQQQYTVHRCIQCGFGTLHPFPTNQELAELYNSPAYHQDKMPQEHAADARIKISLVTQYLPANSSLLDYGCGTGDVLRTAENAGFSAFGYDVAEVTAKAAHDATHCPTSSGDPSRAFTSHQFDAITSFDVIEHVINFPSLLKRWHQWLKEDGYLFVTTPDLGSWDYRLFKKHWYGFTKIPQHVNYFDRSSITQALTENGFEIVRISTWGFSRTLNFIVQKLPGNSLWEQILKLTRLEDKTIYLPMIDMMVVAKKSGKK